MWELVPPEKRISTGQLVNLNLVTSQPSDYLRWTRAGNHLYATASNDWSEKPNKIDRTSRCSSVGRPSQAVPWNSPDLCTFDRVMHPGVVIRNAVSASLHSLFLAAWLGYHVVAAQKLMLNKTRIRLLVLSNYLEALGFMSEIPRDCELWLRTYKFWETTFFFPRFFVS